MGKWGVGEDRGWRKGPWTPEEDRLLMEYVSQYGEGRWSSVSDCTGLNRSGKSSRLRWVNYLRPGLKKGQLSPQEEGIIIELHALWGNKWSTIARYLPGRTDNEIKNYWRTHFKKRNKRPCETKQENRKTHKVTDIQCLQAAAAEEASSSDDLGNSTSCRQEMDMSSSTVENENHHQIILPVVYQESNNHMGLWSDYTPQDCYLWGGLWNLDDQNDQGNFSSYSWQWDIL